jgi:transposase-like protein/IS1 family transposase
MIAFAPCDHECTKKHGKDRSGNQRFRCKDCGATFIEERPRPLGNMQIEIDSACMALKMLLEGMGVRATARITGLDQNTISKLILNAGENCERLLNSISGLVVHDVQIDEIWSFVGMKQKQANARHAGHNAGDSWTYIAVERGTKMILATHIGKRDGNHTDQFLRKLRDAIDTSAHPQISTDGWSGYQYGVPFALGSNIDYGMLIKKYASSQSETRYSPAVIVSAEKVPQFGNPDEDKICTSHIESLNQKIRMHLRRFTRLTAGHSKSVDHHVAMQSIFFAWYNWCRTHSTIKKTPAMASGLAETKWGVRQLLENAVAA